MEEMLLPSLEILRQKNRDYKLILVNSKEKGYRSAAEAYNKTIEKYWKDLCPIVCFTHQDIRFESADYHDRLCMELTANPMQILGVAGIRNGESTTSNLKFYGNKRYITDLHVGGYEKVEVESVDECCFATSKELLSKIKFDEISCFHWHLYAVDFCYATKTSYGIPSYVLPEPVYHKKDGNSGLYVDRNFCLTMFRLLSKYHNKVSYICAPCYFHISTGFWGYIRLLISLIHHIL